MPSIRTLRIFLAAARSGSFAAAGQEVGLTPAAVGQQMRALEDELAQPLFDRGGRAVVLNTAGRKLIAPVQDLVARYDALARGGSDDGLSGSVVMGALVSALMGAFADALWALKREHPRLEVKLFAGQSREFAERVARGELDAAVVTQPPHPPPSRLVWTALYSEPMVMIVPRRPHFEPVDDPLATLARSPFIRFDRQTWTGRLVDDVIARCRVQVHEEMELNSVEAIIELVRLGFGVSIVPRLANVQWSRDRALDVVPLPGVGIERRVGLLERRSHSREAFTAAIKHYFESRGARAPGRRRRGR